METADIKELVEGKRELSTHAAIAEKLKNRNSPKINIDLLTPFFHKGMELTVYPGPMGYDESNAWRETRRFEDLQHINMKKGDEDPKDRKRSDTYLLANAVYSGDSIVLGQDLAELMIQQKEYGPYNKMLIAAAEYANPPREELARETAMLLNTRSVDQVIWMILIKSGLTRVLVDYMSSHSTEEERDWATHELIKVEEVVYALHPVFQADELARTMDTTFKESINLIDTYGTAEEAIKAMNQASKEQYDTETQQE